MTPEFAKGYMDADKFDAIYDPPHSYSERQRDEYKDGFDAGRERYHRRVV